MDLPGLTGTTPDSTAEAAAHIVQLALTPVFLLTGVGTLLGLFNTRLARVSDHIQHVNEMLGGEVAADAEAVLRQHQRRLRHRVFALDASVAFGATGGVLTCASVFVLFVGGVKGSAIGFWLIGLFALALSCTIVALLAFLIDSLLAWHAFRREGPIPKSVAAVRADD